MKALWPFLIVLAGVALLIAGLALVSAAAAMVVAGIAVAACGALFIDFDALKGGRSG